MGEQQGSTHREQLRERIAEEMFDANERAQRGDGTRTVSWHECVRSWPAEAGYYLKAADRILALIEAGTPAPVSGEREPDAWVPVVLYSDGHRFACWSDASSWKCDVERIVEQNANTQTTVVAMPVYIGTPRGAAPRSVDDTRRLDWLERGEGGSLLVEEYKRFYGVKTFRQAIDAEVAAMSGIDAAPVGEP